VCAGFIFCLIAAQLSFIPFSMRLSNSFTAEALDVAVKQRAMVKRGIYAFGGTYLLAWLIYNRWWTRVLDLLDLPARVFALDPWKVCASFVSSLVTGLITKLFISGLLLSAMAHMHIMSSSLSFRKLMPLDVVVHQLGTDQLRSLITNGSDSRGNLEPAQSDDEGVPQPEESKDASAAPHMMTTTNRAHLRTATAHLQKALGTHVSFRQAMEVMMDEMDKQQQQARAEAHTQVPGQAHTQAAAFSKSRVMSAVSVAVSSSQQHKDRERGLTPLHEPSHAAPAAVVRADHSPSVSDRRSVGVEMQSIAIDHGPSATTAAAIVGAASDVGAEAARTASSNASLWAAACVDDDPRLAEPSGHGATYASGDTSD